MTNDKTKWRSAEWFGKADKDGFNRQQLDEEPGSAGSTSSTAGR